MVLNVWSLSEVELALFFAFNFHFRTGCTRLDLMAYLDPASNPRSKPQRLCATNCKSSTPELFTWDNTFCFVLKGNLMQQKSRNLSGQQGEESMIWGKLSCINGCMVKSNLVISTRVTSIGIDLKDRWRGWKHVPKHSWNWFNYVYFRFFHALLSAMKGRLF